jgi:hypothetical protein
MTQISGIHEWMQGRANGDCAVGALARVADMSSQWFGLSQILDLQEISVYW